MTSVTVPTTMEDFVPLYYSYQYFAVLLIGLFGGSTLTMLSTRHAAQARLDGKPNKVWTVFGTSQVVNMLVGALVFADIILMHTLALFSYFLVGALNRAWYAVGLSHLPHQQGAFKLCTLALFLTILWVVARPVTGRIISLEVAEKTKDNAAPTPTACLTA